MNQSKLFYPSTGNLSWKFFLANAFSIAYFLAVREPINLINTPQHHAVAAVLALLDLP